MGPIVTVDTWMLMTLKENEMTTLTQKFGVLIDLPEASDAIVFQYGGARCSIGRPKAIGKP